MVELKEVASELEAEPAGQEAEATVEPAELMVADREESTELQDWTVGIDETQERTLGLDLVHDRTLGLYLAQEHTLGLELAQVCVLHQPLWKLRSRA